ncbi:YbjN domain-containing protein [Sansalvadorimonas sp. 2012CJ34-2]|uniref:YbjN domain-containing protein n=1 Tax=Parendozoicomonas callyspongiae TaxID=2942213 RepID=A0ABT0PK30_9GAMM|nr:YbjN domain-containing protein [Sansalvadorimonas sp. 2012CJ34-2]MCL6271688.1 YbjN domain-containing protein [Sansalvadorimonas sp. 2012CJ34-2]
MQDLLVPDTALLEKWLSDAGYQSYICDQCSGLHISALQTMDGIVDSRLFVEPWGMLFTTEMEVRNAAVMAVVADLTRLNMSFPTLKLFQDLPDESSPMLIASSSILTTQGLTVPQFQEFFGVAVETKRQLLQECQQLQYLAQDTDPMVMPESSSEEKTLLH